MYLALHSTYVAVFNSTYRRIIFNDIIFGIAGHTAYVAVITSDQPCVSVC